MARSRSCLSAFTMCLLSHPRTPQVKLRYWKQPSRRARPARSNARSDNAHTSDNATPEIGKLPSTLGILLLLLRPRKRPVLRPRAQRPIVGEAFDPVHDAVDVQAV